jgi:hypothetical protein
VEDKVKENWNLRGGVIIIGSLLWQDHLENKDQDDIRKKWRNYNLIKKSKTMVRLPIRYGRYSKDSIYTMVFSSDCQKDRKLGTGYIFSFRLKPIKGIKALLTKAKAMSKAEGMERKLENDWGKIAILFNPDKINPEIKKQILLEWNKEVEKIKELEEGSWEVYKLGNEEPCVKSNSKLTIKWPDPLDNQEAQILSELDFLIAAVTKPEHKTKTTYPSDCEVAETVKNDESRFYFCNNIKHGITTFQDNAIINKICP